MIKRLSIAISFAAITSAQVAFAQTTRFVVQPASAKLELLTQVPAIPEKMVPLPLAEAITPGMPLAEIEAMAIDYSPAMARAAAQIQAARGNWLQVGLRNNPTAGYVAEEIGRSGEAGMQGLYVQQTFICGGKRYFRRNVAAWQIREAEQQWALQRQAIVNAVRQAYYSVLLAKLRSEAAGRLEGISKRATDVSQKLLEAGEGDRVSTLQARVELEAARIAAENAHIAEQAAWRELHALTGLAETSQLHVEADLQNELPNFDWPTALARVKRENPRVAAAAMAISRARAALDAAIANGIPNVTAQASVVYDTATDETLAGVQVGRPIRFFNKNPGRIQQAESQVVAAERALDLVEQDLQRQLAEVFNRYAAARAQLARYSGQILPNATDSLDLVTRAYEAGEIDYSRVLLAQRRYFDTTLAWLDSLEQAWRAAVLIEGVLVEDVRP